MNDRKFIVFRVIEHTIIFSMAAGALVLWFGISWLVIPTIVMIAAWELYTHRRDVRLSGGWSAHIEGEGRHALTDVKGEGKVDVHGRIWDAVSLKKNNKEQKIRVLKQKGNILEVEPVEY